MEPTLTENLASANEIVSAFKEAINGSSEKERSNVCLAISQIVQKGELTNEDRRQLGRQLEEIFKLNLTELNLTENQDTASDRLYQTFGVTSRYFEKIIEKWEASVLAHQAKIKPSNYNRSETLSP